MHNIFLLREALVKDYVGDAPQNFFRRVFIKHTLCES